MNDSSNNSWVKAGKSYKVSPDQKSWDVLRMRLENKRLKGSMISLRKWSAAAVILGIISTLIFMFDKFSDIRVSPAFALQTLENSGSESFDLQSGSDIYNMSELKNLREIYDTFSSEDPL